MKLTKDLLDAAKAAKLTKVQMNVLIYFHLYENEGYANFYYKDVIADLGCHHATYYRAVDALANKGFINYTYNNKGYHFIKFKYTWDKEKKEQYLNINKSFIISDGFKKLKASVKRVVLDLLLQTSANAKTSKNVAKKLKSIARAAGIDESNKQLSRKIVDTIESLEEDNTALFDVEKSKNKDNECIYKFKLKKKEMNPLIGKEISLENHESTVAFKDTLELHNFCKENRIKYTEKQFKKILSWNRGGFKNFQEVFKDKLKEIAYQYKSLEADLIVKEALKMKRRMLKANSRSDVFNRGYVYLK